MYNCILLCIVEKYLALPKVTSRCNLVSTIRWEVARADVADQVALLPEQNSPERIKFQVAKYQVDQIPGCKVTGGQIPGYKVSGGQISGYKVSGLNPLSFIAIV